MFKETGSNPDNSSPAQDLFGIIRQCFNKGNLVGEVTLYMHTLVEGRWVQDLVSVTYFDKASGRRHVGNTFPEGVGRKVYDELKTCFDNLGIEVEYEHAR